MNDVMKALGQLAGKLGTTVEGLAPHYVEYIWARAAVLAGIAVVLLGLAPCFLFRGVAILRSTSTDDTCSERGRKDTTSFLLILVGGVCAFAGAAMLGGHLPAVIAPEGYAVSQLLGALK